MFTVSGSTLKPPTVNVLPLQPDGSRPSTQEARQSAHEPYQPSLGLGGGPDDDDETSPQQPGGDSPDLTHPEATSTEANSAPDVYDGRGEQPPQTSAVDEGPLTWEELGHTVTYPVALGQRIGSLGMCLLVDIMAAAARQPSGRFSFEEAFGPRGAAGCEPPHTNDVFSPKDARARLNRISKKALSGAHGDALKTLMLTVSYDTETVFVHKDDALPAWAALVGDAEPERPAGTATQPKTKAAATSKKASKVPADSVAAVSPPENKKPNIPEFPPFELRITRRVDGGFDLVQIEDLPAIQAWCWSNLYPRTPGYALITEPTLRERLVVLHLLEWLGNAAPKLTHLLSGANSHTVAGKMFCGWVYSRSRYTLDPGNTHSTPWSLSDIWHAALDLACNDLLGKPSGGSYAVRTGKMMAAGLDCTWHRLDPALPGGRAQMPDLCNRPDILLEVAKDYVGIGAALLELSSGTWDKRQTRRFCTCGLISSGYEENAGSTPPGSGICSADENGRGKLMKAKEAFMRDDGTVDLNLLRDHICAKEFLYAKALGLLG